MKLRVQSDIIADALDKISAALESKVGEKEAFLSTRFDVVENKMKISARSSFISAEAIIDCESDIQAPIVFGCSGKLVKNIISSLPSCLLSFSVTDRSVSIRMPTGSYRLNLISEEHLMKPIGFDDMNFLDISFSSFLYSLNRVSFCTHKGAPDKAYKAAICINDKHFVSTDGYRLAFTKNTCMPPDAPPILIKSECAGRLGKLFRGGEDSGFVNIGLNQEGRPYSLILANGNIRTSLRLLHEETYPNYSGVIPGGTHSTCIVDKAIFHSALERVLMMSGDTYSADFVFSGNRICMETSDTIGGAKEEVPCQSGLEQEMRFNVRMLLEGVRRCEDEKINIEIRGPSSPIVIKEGGFSNVIMPVKSE